MEKISDAGKPLFSQEAAESISYQVEAFGDKLVTHLLEIREGPIVSWIEEMANAPAVQCLGPFIKCVQNVIALASEIFPELASSLQEAASTAFQQAVQEAHTFVEVHLPALAAFMRQDETPASPGGLDLGAALSAVFVFRSVFTLGINIQEAIKETDIDKRINAVLRVITSLGGVLNSSSALHTVLNSFQFIKNFVGIHALEGLKAAVPFLNIAGSLLGTATILLTWRSRQATHELQKELEKVNASAFLNHLVSSIPDPKMAQCFGEPVVRATLEEKIENSLKSLKTATPREMKSLVQEIRSDLNKIKNDPNLDMIASAALEALVAEADKEAQTHFIVHLNTKSPEFLEEHFGVTGVDLQKSLQGISDTFATEAYKGEEASLKIESLRGRITQKIRSDNLSMVIDAISTVATILSIVGTIVASATPAAPIAYALMAVVCVISIIRVLEGIRSGQQLSSTLDLDKIGKQRRMDEIERRKGERAEKDRLWEERMRGNIDKSG